MEDPGIPPSGSRRDAWDQLKAAGGVSPKPATSSKQPTPPAAVNARVGPLLHAAVGEHLLQLGRVLREVDAETDRALAERLCSAVSVSTASLSSVGPWAAAASFPGGDLGGRRQAQRHADVGGARPPVLYEVPTPPENLQVAAPVVPSPLSQGPQMSPVPSSASSSHGAGLLPRFHLTRKLSNTSLPDAAQHRLSSPSLPDAAQHRLSSEQHNSGDSERSSQDMPGRVRPASLEGLHGSSLSVPSGDWQSASRTLTEDSRMENADIAVVLAGGGPRKHSKGASSDNISMWNSASSRTFEVLRSPWLEAVWACLIVLNTVVMIAQEEYLGAQVGYELGYYTHYGSPEYSKDHWPGAERAFIALESSFAVLFTVEVLLSMTSKGLRFFRDPWDLLDLTVVVCSDLSVLFVFIFSDDSLSEGPINVSMFRLLRLAKLVRLVKLLRKIEGFDALHLMSTALKGSLAALGWSFVLIVLMQTFFALVMSFVIRSYFLSDSNIESRPEVTAQAFLYYGTFMRSLFTLFELALANYPTVARFMIEEIGEGWLVPLVLYKFAIGVAVIGVLNGVFFQETFKVASNDDTIMVRTKQKAANLHREKMTRLFKCADRQGIGKIGLRDFRHVLRHHTIQMWLASMDLDCTDADQLFALIANGEFITVEELIDGIFRLKGAARSIDLKVLLQRLGMPLRKDAEPPSPDDWHARRRGREGGQGGSRQSADSMEPE